MRASRARPMSAAKVDSSSSLARDLRTYIMPRTVENRQEEGIVSIGTTRELFVHELSDAMSAEQQILKMLPELQKEALNPELTQALQEHEQETKGQIRNLEEVIKHFTRRIPRQRCWRWRTSAARRKPSTTRW